MLNCFGLFIIGTFQNTTYYGAICTAWNSHTPSRSAMPSISKLQKLVEAAWAQGFDVQVNELVSIRNF